jgi:nitrite reductase/ring-hydroxylating ferredoxin subunit
MKKNILYICIAILFGITSCSKKSSNNNCNFLLNVAVNTSINLNLPQYNALQFISQAVYVPNVGNKGIIVMNSGTGYVAWDASDPSHTPNACSRLEIVGAEAVCGCDDGNTYSLFTGQPLRESNVPCGLKFYPVEQNGNMLFISN